MSNCSSPFVETELRFRKMWNLKSSVEVEELNWILVVVIILLF